jgi:hypothetical protein
MDPCGISLGDLCFHVLPYTSTFNTFGVYLDLGCMLRSRKLMIHSGSWRLFYDLKEYIGPALPFNIISLMQM